MNSSNLDYPITTNRKASEKPLEAINKIAYPGQPENRKMYYPGYENYFESLPILIEDESLESKLFVTKTIMSYLSEKLKKDGNLLQTPGYQEFNRTILALEEPEEISKGVYKEKSEIVVAHWGLDHTSPVHGHATGYMHEEILKGKIRVNTYRIVRDNIVRIVETQIKGEGVFVSNYAPHNPLAKNSRETLVHNFTAVEPTVSLHYLPEHTRDGRDNTFELEEFRPITPEEVTRIDSKQGLYSQVGDVILVRSINVPEYGDHFIIITGHPVMKEHGFRPQERAILAGVEQQHLLNKYPLKTGLTLLKLDIDVRNEFLEFHGINVEGKTVTFPND